MPFVFFGAVTRRTRSTNQKTPRIKQTQLMHSILNDWTAPLGSTTGVPSRQPLGPQYTTANNHDTPVPIRPQPPTPH